MKRHALVVGLVLAVAASSLAPLSAVAAELPVSGVVTGIVTLAGTPVAATEVGWFDPTTGAGGQTRTGADGRYSLTVADGHPFVVYAGIDHAATGRWLPVDAERYTGVFVGATGSDYLYQSLAPFTMGGTVDVSLTVPGAIVGKAAGLAKQRVELLTPAGNTVKRVRASATGRYEFDGLIPGHYRVSAFSPLEKYESFTSGDLAVAAGVSTRYDPRLVRTGTVSGVVRVRGKAVRDVFVSVAYVGAENGTSTDAHGRYTIENVPTGKATLLFSGQGTKGTGDYSYRGYQKLVTTRVKSGKTRRLDVAVPRPTLLTGSITPSKGAKSFEVRLVDGKGQPAVDHFVKVGSKKTRIPLSLPGIRAGTYTVVVTDDRRTRYAKKKITLAYGKTTSLRAVSLTKKTLSISGAIVGARPYEVAFENAYGFGDDLSFAGGHYRITGLIPGSGVVTFNAGGRTGPKPYYTASRRYPVELSTSTSLDVTSGGPQLGLFTGTVAVGSLPIATGAYLRGSTRDIPFSNDQAVDEGYVVRGAIVGTAETDGTDTYTLASQYNGWPKEFVSGAPFWLELANGPISVTTLRGTTVDIGTVLLVERR